MNPGGCQLSRTVSCAERWRGSATDVRDCRRFQLCQWRLAYDLQNKAAGMVLHPPWFQQQRVSWDALFSWKRPTMAFVPVHASLGDRPRSEGVRSHQPPPYMAPLASFSRPSPRPALGAAVRHRTSRSSMTRQAPMSTREGVVRGRRTTVRQLRYARQTSFKLHDTRRRFCPAMRAGS